MKAGERQPSTQIKPFSPSLLWAGLSVPDGDFLLLQQLQNNDFFFFLSHSPSDLELPEKQETSVRGRITRREAVMFTKQLAARVSNDPGEIV